MSCEPTCTLLQRYPTLFWDFDGVIKESLAVKAEAFERLFAPFGTALAARVRAHHEGNGGRSRFEKLPLYLQWAGVRASASEIARYCELYSAAVSQRVIESEWVPGVREYLLANHPRQVFVLVTGTPQGEIEQILRALEIAQCFREVHGAPREKTEAVCAVLARGCPRPALFIGDTAADRCAAREAGIDFMLRRTALNRELQRACDSPQFDDFRDV